MPENSNPQESFVPAESGLFMTLKAYRSDRGLDEAMAFAASLMKALETIHSMIHESGLENETTELECRAVSRLVSVVDVFGQTHMAEMLMQEFKNLILNEN